MAERGDPYRPAPVDAGHDHDDAVGFSSPRSLAGQSRAPAAPATEGVRTDPRDMLGAAVIRPDLTGQPEPVVFAPVQPAPSAGVEGVMGLYAVYALILFAVPTLGFSAMIAVLAVFRVSMPDTALAQSHFVYQRRTLLIGGTAAAVGGLLVLVGLGVFVLFGLAAWLIIRGAAGVLKLKAGAPIDDPRGWWT